MTIPVHRFTFILLIFLSIPSTSAAQTVNIPDPNLRAAIAAELGKASGDPITTSDMAALTSLTARESNISDLTGLEHAINLTSLDLGRQLHLGHHIVVRVNQPEIVVSFGQLDIEHHIIVGVNQPDSAVSWV